MRRTRFVAAGTPLMAPASSLHKAAAAAAFLVLALAPGSASAQTTELADGPAQEIDFDRPEAWAMEWTSSLTLLTSLGPPRAREAGEVELSLEVGWIPTLSEDQRRSASTGPRSRTSTSTCCRAPASR
jgi:hypothetical protein